MLLLTLSSDRYMPSWHPLPVGSSQDMFPTQTTQQMDHPMGSIPPPHCFSCRSLYLTRSMNSSSTSMTLSAACSASSINFSNLPCLAPSTSQASPPTSLLMPATAQPALVPPDLSSPTLQTLHSHLLSSVLTAQPKTVSSNGSHTPTHTLYSAPQYPLSYKRESRWSHCRAGQIAPVPHTVLGS